VNPSSGTSEAYPVVAGEVSYQDIRDQIQTGDILLFSGRVWLSRVIERISHSKYSHVAFLTKWEDRIIAMQSDLRGVEVIPASMLVCKYDGKVEWWRLGAAHRQHFDSRDFLDRSLTLIGIRYGYLSLIGLGFRMLLGWTVKPKNSHLRPSSLYCSNFVSYCYNNEHIAINAKAGVDGTSPSDFALSGLFEQPYPLSDGSNSQACEQVLVSAKKAGKQLKNGAVWNGKVRRESKVAASQPPAPVPAPEPSAPPRLPPAT
jgi:hypothetical protein